jgi:hypothetical protein
MLAFRPVQQSNHCAREEFLYELQSTTARVLLSHQRPGAGMGYKELRSHPAAMIQI